MAALIPTGTGSPASSEGHTILDVIDSLRSQGLNHFVDLPQIVACGDQSSGKSSVLSAIIGGSSFPTKETLCTRFATELILRRSPNRTATARILPGRGRSQKEKDQLAKAQFYQPDGINISAIVEDAKKTMALCNTEQTFYDDVLQIEITGPQQPHLTIVDLPGFFITANKDQSEQDAKLVANLALSYMKSPRSIILAVVSAKNDFVLQQVTQCARQVDPEGTRTLGLITKPDTLDAGSESERFYIDLAQNKDVSFRLGWHVLQNRSYATRNMTTAERDQAETDFFCQGAWEALQPGQLGVAALRTRLSDTLHNRIMDQLPAVLEDIEMNIEQCEERLRKLGVSRVTIDEQRHYLFDVSMAFTGIMKAAVDGMYNGTFFSCGTDSSIGYKKRLRAVTQNILVEFAERMQREGHERIIERDDDPAQPEDPRRISRSDYLEKVRLMMRQSRGCELPGSYNPLIVTQLFAEQCKPWKALVRGLADQVLQSVEFVIEAALDYSTDYKTAAGLSRIIIGPYMKTLKDELRAKLDELLTPHRSGHPVTYTNTVAEGVQKRQTARTREALERAMKTYFEDDYKTEGSMTVSLDMKTLVDVLAKETRRNMTMYELAVDTMMEYYKLAREKIVDDIGAFAIERLLQELPGLLSSTIICNLTSEEVQSIAAESKASREERRHIKEKLKILRKGLTQLGGCKKYLSPFARPNHTFSSLNSKVIHYSSMPLESITNQLAKVDMKNEPADTETAPSSSANGDFSWDGVGYPFKARTLSDIPE
ncbi:P-loop containing nucleoside triphosphate hydrolase protein [Xylariaceae sp. FL1272]|nr:P-loop containing nucleoside triphosphate hydrolase protein [Xylariaceae sp. FL1272]